MKTGNIERLNAMVNGEEKIASDDLMVAEYNAIDEHVEKLASAIVGMAFGEGFEKEAGAKQAIVDAAAHAGRRVKYIPDAIKHNAGPAAADAAGKAGKIVGNAAQDAKYLASVQAKKVPVKKLLAAGAGVGAAGGAAYAVKNRKNLTEAEKNAVLQKAAESFEDSLALEKEASGLYEEAQFVKAASLRVMYDIGLIDEDDVEKLADTTYDELEKSASEA